MPEVGSQPSVTANKRMPVIATQKSGALAPASEITLAVRSNAPPGRYAASEPTTTARPTAMTMVSPASFKVVGNASSTTSSAGRALRIDSPKSKLGEIGEKPPELHEQRIGEPVLLRKLGARLERGIERQIEIGRIARQPGEEEDEYDQAQQRDQAVQGTSGEIVPQCPSPGLPSRRPARIPRAIRPCSSARRAIVELGDDHSRSRNASTVRSGARRIGNTIDNRMYESTSLYHAQDHRRLRLG